MRSSVTPPTEEHLYEATLESCPRRRNWNALCRLAVALVTFGMVTTLAVLANRWHMSSTWWLGHAPPVFYRPASALAVLGETWLSIPAIAIVAGWLFLRQKHAAIMAAWLGVWLVIGSVVEIALKIVLGHRSVGGHVYHMGLPFGFSGLTASTFPSGHTLRATLIARLALRRFPWLGAGFVASMMAAVVYLRYHSLTEALGGVCLGWVLVEAAGVLWKP